MVSFAQTATAVVILLLLFSFIIFLGIKRRREDRRRSKLPIEERQRLEDEDATWAQTYGF